MNPKRIQRFRRPGWRMPENAIYVGRPTQWGNPYCISVRPLRTRNHVLALYRDWARTQLIRDPHWLDELRGKDLACWCPLDVPCHVAVLLELLALPRLQSFVSHINH